MISTEKQFLFIHIPKTGGNSLQNILKDYSDDEIVVTAEHQDGVERFEVSNRQYDIHKHSTLFDYQSVMDAETYRSLYKFAVIRNPWDRLISSYFSPHRGVDQWDRDAFLAHMDTVPTAQHFLFEKPGRMGKLLSRLGVSQKPLDAYVDCIVKFENLEEGFREVCQNLGISAVALPRRNASVRAHYSDYYDDELIELVGEKYALEVGYGGYRFERSAGNRQRNG